MTGYGENNIALQVGVNTDVGPWKRLLATQGVPFVFSKGAAMVDIKINGEAGEEWKRPRLDFNVDAKLNSVAGTYKKLKAKLLATKADIKTSGRINQLMQVTDLDSEVNVESAGFKIPKVVSSGRFLLGAKVASPDPLHDKVVASLRFSSKKMTLPKTYANTPENYNDKPMWLKNQRNSRHGVDFGYNQEHFDLNKYYRRYSESLLAVDDNLGRVLNFLETKDFI